MGELAKYQANIAAIKEAEKSLHAHPFSAELPSFRRRLDRLDLPGDSWLVIEHQRFRYSGTVERVVAPNIRRRATPEEWTYVLCRAALHVAMNHLDPEQDDMAWHMACWAIAEHLASATGVGRRPADHCSPPAGYSLRSEHELASKIREADAFIEFAPLSLGGEGRRFWSFEAGQTVDDKRRGENSAMLAKAVRAAAVAAVEVAGGRRASITAKKEPTAACRAAMSWVISEFPMLSALGASFDLIEDEEICCRLDIPVAAVYGATREIYVNPRARLTESELVFVHAHELLHVGLRHDVRRRGRDPYLWNVACDYVINGWLIQMKVGSPPERVGYLHDDDLDGVSAEDVYEKIVTDLRLKRRIAKQRAWAGGGDMRNDKPESWWSAGGGADLDAFYRRALAEGHRLHVRQGRGLVPAGLVEEIRALEHRPIPWDVKLAQWLDAFFPPLERRRSYGRMSRRQSATPDIPRPAWVLPDEDMATRTFAVVLDTSWSMDRRLLGLALGAIESYALSRDVPHVRLIECDAHPHDAGYVAPETLSGMVEIHGRGGTTLQPAFELLDRIDAFPKDGPVLVITDGYIDRIQVKREHAYLMPEGARLPFGTTAPIFALE